MSEETKNFIDEFKTTNFFKELCNKDNIIFIYIGGSRMWNIDDDISDFDICVFNSEKYDNPDNYILNDMKYKDVHGHFYWDNIYNSLLGPIGGLKWYKCYRGITLGNIKKDHILYLNPEYKKLMEYILNNQDNIFKISLYYSYKLQEECISSKCDLTTFDNINCRPKYLAHFLLYSYRLTGEKIEYDFVKKIKRLDEKDLTEGDKKYVSERLKIIKEFADSYIPNYDKYQKEINDIVYSIKQ